MTNFLNFNDFVLNEHNRKKEEMTPILKKSLSELGMGIKNEEEIIKLLEILGFEQKHPKKITAEYVFYYPETDQYYLTFSTGYVRYNQSSLSWRGDNIMTKTPINRSEVKSSKDRLLLVLRRAMKIRNLYNSWKSSGRTVSEFVNARQGSLKGQKYGL